MNMKNLKAKKQMFNAIDLFCGGGGLTVGLKQANFKVIAGVEIDAYATDTYRSNHPDIKIFKKNITDISGKDIINETGVKQIDLLTGCPPCQGFSSLTYKHKKNDNRNNLIFEILRLAKELKPRIIMLENVSGLARGKKAETIFKKFVTDIKALGYYIDYKVFEVAEFGVPQYRKRLVLFASKHSHMGLPHPTHGKNSQLLPYVTSGYVFSKIKNSPKSYVTSRDNGTIMKENWHVVRDMSDINKQRLSYAKAGENWQIIPEHIRPKCHQNGYQGFSNVYGRMNPKEPSPTITRGCTTISMGRFGHPTELRTISVREAALLQTFPYRYKFPIHSIEDVCKVIGNALPCLFAQKISEHCYDHLNDNS